MTKVHLQPQEASQVNGTVTILQERVKELEAQLAEAQEAYSDLMNVTDIKLAEARRGHSWLSDCVAMLQRQSEEAQRVSEDAKLGECRANRRLAEKQKDTERLDWMCHDYNGAAFTREFAQSWREAIDAARAAEEPADGAGEGEG